MKVDPTLCLKRAQHVIDAQGGGLPRRTLVNGLRAATQFRTHAASGRELALGASHFGGRPHMPASVEWPHWAGYEQADHVLDEKRAAGLRDVLRALGAPTNEAEPIRLPRGKKPTPLSFLAQIDLDETPDPTGLLPSHGYLCFFYDVEQFPWGFDPRDAGAARVIFFESDKAMLTSVAPPAGAVEYTAHRVDATVTGTLPRWPYQLELELEGASEDEYWALAEEHIAGPAPHHRLFGWPKQVQGEMDLECQLVTNGIYCGTPEGYAKAEAKRLETGREDWVMLMQIDTDDEGPGWMWGDNGCLYFWIRKQDLAARRFDRTWTILQCH